jgi:hypothetical protein
MQRVIDGLAVTGVLPSYRCAIVRRSSMVEFGYHTF